jgi:hypothetical protein
LNETVNLQKKCKAVALAEECWLWQQGVLVVAGGCLHRRGRFSWKKMLEWEADPRIQRF